MKTHVQIELVPLPVPSFATIVGKPGLRQEGMKQPARIDVGDLSDSAINEWVNELATAIKQVAREQRSGGGQAGGSYFNEQDDEYTRR